MQALPSGVLYKIIREGSGAKLLESGMVEINYRGAVINGTEFDATEPRVGLVTTLTPMKFQYLIWI
jgi:FKBP-type peptidyl-prolyl cis-trans isomerase